MTYDSLDLLIAFGCGGLVGTILAAYTLSRVLLPSVAWRDKDPLGDPENSDF